MAVNYQRLKKEAGKHPVELEALRNMAVEGILRRTLRVIRHFRRKTRLRRVPWVEAQSGEIALMETIDRALHAGDLQPEDIMVESRREKPLDLALMIDTSLSMNGRKLALCAVASAVLALRLRAEAFSIVSFGSTSKVLKPLERRMNPRDTILTILDASMLGYTNIHAGLHKGLSELRKGRSPLKAGILLSDGKHTEGPDPTEIAGRYRRLEILMTLDHNMDRNCCQRMAAAGHGHVTEVRRYDHLPERLLALLRSLQQ